MIALLLLALVLDVIRENPNQASGLREPDQAINDGCVMEGRLTCPLLVGTHVYAVESSKSYVHLTNRTASTVSITRVQTSTINGTWAEISAYLDYFGTCPAPPGYCGWQPEGVVGCPCQKDIDLGPGLSLVGAVGNLFEAPSTRLFPDLAWGADGFSVAPGSFVVLHDNFHSSPATMYAVTVEARKGADLVMRQPKLDQVIRCNGDWQWTGWEPWQADTDMVITGAQIYAIGGTNSTTVTAACVYVLDTPAWPILWSICGDQIRTTGNATFSREVKAGQWIVGNSLNKCAAPQVWDYVASISARRVP